jgi:XTP/dITP diphosphohydrolase
MTRILVATGNAHKTAEIRQILGPGFEVSDLSSHPEIPSAEETGASFLENATIKSVGASNWFEGLVLSDDSGLEVDALGGAPGVRSARYSGEGATDATNREKLLRELSRVEQCNPGISRSARFHCVMVLAQKGKVLGSFDGRIEGRILRDSKGKGGFGYDPLFAPEGYEQTFAELPPEIKNALSHRGRALAKVSQALHPSHPSQ